MRLIGAAELARLAPADLIEPVRRALVAYSAGSCQIAASVLDLPGGDVHVKSAVSRDSDYYVVKVASWVPANRASGRSVGGGAHLVCSAASGHPLAVIEDGHRLTDLRTAAAGAIATDLLANPGPLELGIVGTGVQARLQVAALASVRTLASVCVWGRDHDRAVALAADISDELKVVARSAMTVEDLVSQSDAVITATASREALVLGEWLRPGQHLTALGADDDSKREIDSLCLARADRLFVDSRTQTTALAEIGTALREGLIELAAVSGELGELIDGRVAGRQRQDQITVAKLSGIGVQDLAAAELVMQTIRVDAE